MNRQLLNAIANKDGNALASMSGPERVSKRVVSDEVVGLVNRLFDRLKAIFPASVSTVFRDAEIEKRTKQEWLRAFARHGITNANLIAGGVTKAADSGSAFWPSPGEFIQWCKDARLEAMGLPSVDEVMNEFNRYAKERYRVERPEDFKWKSDIFYWLILDLRTAMMDRSLGDDQLIKLAKKLLAGWAEKLEAGGSVPSPVVRIADLRRPETVVEQLGLKSERGSELARQMLDRVRKR